MASELASILVPIGMAGAVFAALCAIVAAVAIMRGAAGLAGGAVGLWIPGALLSSTASFASQWTPMLVSGGMLVAMLVIGAVARGVVNAGEPARQAAREARAAAVVDAATVAEGAASATPRSTKPATSTGSQPALAG
ncbi:hypothetical protein [Microbacterium foliorum]|uniref:hypothetical protein n=1 Tax=Microbacterium foliorum TaxID=104336 RepID=UPI001E2F7B72|nr:hypothetical protein [Microbacterium foliorum]